MRIIKDIVKDTENVYARIAHEMYNIEASAETYRDGGRLANPIPGYPRFTVDGVEYRVKSVNGRIYYSGDVVLDVARIQTAIEALGPDSHLDGYHTVNVGECVSVKTRRTNKGRQFSVERYNSTTTTPRFTWTIQPISAFRHDIDAEQPDVVDRYVCSIFYDPINICTLDDGAVTNEFSRKCLVGWSHYLHEAIMLSTYLNPIAFELNQYWRESLPFGKSVLEIHRNLPAAKVYRGEYANIKIAPVVTESGETCKDVCSRCRHPLYDDIYVLTTPVKNPDCSDGIAICPLCIHMCEKRLEMRYLYVKVVRHPRSIIDVIEASDESSERKAILKSASRGISVNNLQGTTVSYYDIGDYIAVRNIDDYLCSKLSTTNTKRVVDLKDPGSASWILAPIPHA